MKLRNLTLGALPPSVRRPAYDRSALRPGIVHVGVGNFHRAHQATYLDDLFATGRDHDWAIRGAGVRPADAVMREKLARQDWLSTVMELAPDVDEARVIGAMTDWVAPGPPGAAASSVAQALRDPAIRIVSLTVTEGGYYLDPASGVFDPGHRDMIADAVAPERPNTVFGAIVAALRARRDDGVAPFAVMSCDNLPGNGEIARGAVVGLAGMSDPALARWIEAEVAFPNGMVDRITPATTDAQRALLQERFGLEDAAPVFCEPFRQWVLEDRFPGGRPAFEEVGVELVSDVAPFEAMKLRVLNGGHALVAYLAALRGHVFVHEAMADPLVRGFLDRVEIDEILPVVPPPPGVDLAAYQAVTAARFENPAIGDTVARLCFDGSNRQPKFILPTIRDRLAQGLPVDGLALETALWCRCWAGETDDGAPIDIEDEAAARLSSLARAARDEPTRFLDQRGIFGDLADAPAYRKAFSAALAALWSDGTAATVARYLEAGSRPT